MHLFTKTVQNSIIGKQDFNELYELMNGMPLREMDRIIYPVCTLCRDHERDRFIHGVQVGMRLAEELK